MPVTANDRDELDRLYREYAQTLERKVQRRITAPRALVEDACANAWVALAKRPDVLHDERVAGWLYVVAFREAIALLRARNLLRDEPEDAPHNADFETRVDANDLAQAIRKLAPRQARVLFALMLGCSYAQIAAATGYSPTAVNSGIVKGRTQLRALEALA